MSKKRDQARRVAKEFAKDLDNIKLARVKFNLDDKFISDERLTRGILRDEGWGRIKERLSKTPRSEEDLE